MQDRYHAGEIHLPGKVGIVSRSGHSRSCKNYRHGIWSAVAGIGGDSIPGSNFTIGIPAMFEKDPATEAIVMVKEIKVQRKKKPKDYIQLK